MRTALKWALLAAAMAATSYLSHRFWPSQAGATLAAGPDAGMVAPAAPPWSREGFRDAERCDLFGDPPFCS